MHLANNRPCAVLVEISKPWKTYLSSIKKTNSFISNWNLSKYGCLKLSLCQEFDWIFTEGGIRIGIPIFQKFAINMLIKDWDPDQRLGSHLTTNDYDSCCLSPFISNLLLSFWLVSISSSSISVPYTCLCTTLPIIINNIITYLVLTQ